MGLDRLGSNAIADDAIAAVDIADGSISTAKLANDAVTTAKVADTVNLGRRNIIINGAMQVWQRGTSGTLTGTNNYLVDRFHGSRLGGLADIFDASQETDVPTGQGFKYSYKVTQDGTSTTLSGTNAAMFGYRPEGQDWNHLEWGTANAKSITVQFWVKSSVTGTFAFTIASSNSDQDIAKEYTISSANTWEKKTFTIPGPTSGTWTSDNSVFGYFSWGWCGVLGSARETSNIDAWGAGTGGGTVTVTANSTNALATTSGATWQITGVQMEVGDTATPFEHRSYAEELLLCQRYFYTGGSSSDLIYIYFNVTSGQAYYYTIFHPVEMRAAPTLTIENESHSNFDGITVWKQQVGSFGYYDVATGTGRGGWAFSFKAEAEL